MRLLRQRIFDVSVTGAIAALVSLFPFITVYQNPEVLQPQRVRIAFLVCIVTSWPLLLLFLVPTVCIYFHLRQSDPEGRYITSSCPAVLNVIILSTAVGVLGSSCLLVAQAIWVWAASRVRIVWLLSVVVLGLAVLLIYTASVLAVCVTAVRTRSTVEENDAKRIITFLKPRPRPREVTVLEIDKDIYSPQKVVATIPKPGSELAF